MLKYMLYPFYSLKLPNLGTFLLSIFYLRANTTNIFNWEATFFFMWSFKDEPLKYSCYLSPSSVNNLVLSQEQFIFVCCEVFNPTEGNGKECELSQASCRGHRWNLKSRSQLGAPEAGKLRGSWKIS